MSNAPPRADVHGLGSFGFFGNLGGNEGGGIAITGMVKYRHGALVIGPSLELGTAIFGYFYYGAAATGGFSLRPHRNLRFELLGAIGGHYYKGVGRSWLLGKDPGASAGLPYAGARGSIGWVFGARTNHFELGVFADYQNDLRRVRVTYDYPTSGGWFDGDGHAEHIVGVARLGFGMEFGGTHDML